MSYQNLNSLKTHSDRITKLYRQVAKVFYYSDIKFSASRKDYSKIEKKNNIGINLFDYENAWFIQNQIKKIEDYMDILLIMGNINSHYDIMFKSKI